MKERVLIIDYLRVLAILVMIAYHLAYDLSAFYGFQINVYSGPWKLLEQACAGLFLILVGWSFLLSWKRTPLWQKYLKRGIAILGYGIIVSIATLLFDPTTYVRFGILHLIGVSVMMLPLFTKLRGWVLVLAFNIIALGSQIPYGTAVSPLLLPIGFTVPGFQSVDYFPLLPWFGMILFGLAIGNTHPQRNAPSRPSGRILKVIAAVSKHSLLIYMLHQPILLLVLRMVLGKPQA